MRTLWRIVEMTWSKGGLGLCWASVGVVDPGFVDDIVCSFCERSLLVHR